MYFEPRNKEFADTCPYCESEGGVSLEHQELSMNDEKTILYLYNGFECFHCADSWSQEIEIELGNAIKNEVTL